MKGEPGRVSIIVKTVMEVAEYCNVFNNETLTQGTYTKLKDRETVAVPRFNPPPKFVLTV